MALSASLKRALKSALAVKLSLYDELIDTIDGASSGIADNAADIATLDAAAVKKATATAVQAAVVVGPYAVGAGSTGEVRFLELAAGGTNYVGFKAADALAGNQIWVLPAADGTINQVLATDGAAAMSWIDVLRPSAASDVQDAVIVGPFGVGAGETGEVRFLELAAGGTNYVGFKAADALAGNQIWVLPAADGGAGECLVTDGAGTLSFAAPVVTGAGGTLTGTLIMDDENEIRFREATGAGVNYIGLKAAAALAGDVTFELPVADGTINQVLATDGAAAMSWIDVLRPSAASDVQDAVIVGPFGVGAGETGEVRFLELAAGGANYVGFKAADALAADVIWVLPAADGTANQMLATDGAGGLQWLTAVRPGIATAVQAAILVGPYGAAAGNTGEVRFLELAAGGTNFVGFKAPDALVGDQIWVLPAADGTANQMLATDGAGALSFASVDVANCAANLFAEVTGTLTAAQVRQLNATPIELIAAPGAGFAIVVDEVQLFMDWNANAYDSVAAGEDIAIEYSGGADIVHIETTGFMDQVNDEWRYAKPSTYDVDATTAGGIALDTVANTAVDITVLVGELAAANDPANGDSPLRYRVRYHVVPLLA